MNYGQLQVSRLETLMCVRTVACAVIKSHHYDDVDDCWCLWKCAKFRLWNAVFLSVEKRILIHFMSSNIFLSAFSAFTVYKGHHSQNILKHATFFFSKTGDFSVLKYIVLGCKFFDVVIIYREQHHSFLLIFYTAPTWLQRETPQPLPKCFIFSCSHSLGVCRSGLRSSQVQTKITHSQCILGSPC